MNRDPMHHSVRSIRIATLVAATVACPAFASGLAGQSGDGSRPIDRWLVTSGPADVAGAAAPLVATEGRAFPDRAVDVGPGTWRLVREDSATTFRFDGMDGGGATLAHAYVKSGTDGPIQLDVSTPGCEAARVWLNGQLVGGEPSPWTVQLAGGWNTFLIGLPAPCPPEVSAILRAARVPVPRDSRPLDPGRLRIQASRPPGIRANQPAGTVTLGMPRPTHLVWRAGADRLDARVEYAIAAWGRDAGDAAPEPAGTGEDREAPPSVDLTGEWSITLYLPMGVERLRADLEMDEDGRLEGDLDGERIDGSVRDGWVSEERFGWTTRWAGPGRGFDVRFVGRVEDDEMSGTLEFEGTRDFEPRPGLESSFGFEGRREEAEAERDTTGAAGGEPAPDRPRRPGARPGFGPPADTEALHAQIRRQLLPPRRPEAPAPSSVSLELRFDGERLVGATRGLRPGHAVTLGGTVPFDRVREAALDDRGLRVRIAWGETTREREGRLPAETVLEAFHAPIALAAADSSGGLLEGSFRVPDRLDGFTLRTLEGQWSVDGEPVSDGLLCSPCRKGTRLEIRVTGTDEARVRVSDPGYPEARASADAAPAEEWLRALSDPRRYREMASRG